MKNKKANNQSIESLITCKKSMNINQVHEERLTFGEKVSDGMANFAGSWTFIILFMIILTSWIAINSIAFFIRPFDPYPYILMNLILSSIAALQAPIIMMSQNRQEKKDRIKTEMDYQINLKAEILVEEVIKRLERIENNQKTNINNNNA